MHPLTIVYLLQDAGESEHEPKMCAQYLEAVQNAPVRLVDLDLTKALPPGGVDVLTRSRRSLQQQQLNINHAKQVEEEEEEEAYKSIKETADIDATTDSQTVMNNISDYTDGNDDASGVN
jgi:hypothetical protein